MSQDEARWCDVVKGEERVGGSGREWERYRTLSGDLADLSKQSIGTDGWVEIDEMAVMAVMAVTALMALMW